MKRTVKRLGNSIPSGGNMRSGVAQAPLAGDQLGEAHKFIG
jgi:hypothetical protein